MKKIILKIFLTVGFVFLFVNSNVRADPTNAQHREALKKAIENWMDQTQEFLRQMGDVRGLRIVREMGEELISQASSLRYSVSKGKPAHVLQENQTELIRTYRDFREAIDAGMIYIVKIDKDDVLGSQRDYLGYRKVVFRQAWRDYGGQ